MVDFKELTQSGWYETTHAKYKYVNIDIEASKEFDRPIFSGCLSATGQCYGFAVSNLQSFSKINLFTIPSIETDTQFRVVKYCGNSIFPEVVSDDLKTLYQNPYFFVLTTFSILLSKYIEHYEDISCVKKDTELGGLYTTNNQALVINSLLRYYDLSSEENPENLNPQLKFLYDKHVTVQKVLDTILDEVGL